MLRAYFSCVLWSTSTFTPGMTNTSGGASWNAPRAATGPLLVLVQFTTGGGTEGRTVLHHDVENRNGHEGPRDVGRGVREFS